MTHQIRVRRALALLLAALLCLPLAACGDKGSGKIPGGSGGERGATEEKSAHDGLVTDGIVVDRTVKAENGCEVHVSAHLPQLNAGSADAQAINLSIEGAYVHLTNFSDDELGKYFGGDVTISWESRWYGDIVSLVILEEQIDAGSHYSVFHYDFAQEKKLSSEDMLAQLGASESDYAASVTRAAVQTFDGMFAGGSTGVGGGLTLLRAKTAGVAAEGVNGTPFCVDEDGSVTAFATIFVPAGAGWTERPVEVSFDYAAKPLTASDGMATASVAADGSVTVRFEQRAGVDLSRYGVVCGKDYPVSGCFGRYEKLFVGSIGPDYAPYLFLLTERHTVEYASLLSGADLDALVCGGVCYDIGTEAEQTVEAPVIVDFASGKDAMGFDTVFAVDKAGKRYDLSPAASKLGAFVPPDMTGAWESEENEGTRYTLHIFSDTVVGLEIDEANDAEGVFVPYTGFMGFLGVNENGLVYRYTVTGPDGNDITGAMALLPQWEMLYVRAAGGEQIIEAKDGPTILFRSEG